MEGSAYEGEEKEHLSPLGLSEGQWAFHVSIRHHFLRRPFLQTDEIFKKQMSVLNEALDFVKTRYEGMEEQFSNNRVIVRPLSWLVCIGPFQPPNKGGLPLLRSRKSFLHFQFFLQTRGGQKLLRSRKPFSIYSFFYKQGRAPTTEIRKPFLHVRFFLMSGRLEICLDEAKLQGPGLLNDLFDD